MGSLKEGRESAQSPAEGQDMPEENRKLWARLVKRERRTTWAVVGVAIVAVLLATLWLPALSQMAAVSFSPESSSSEHDIEIREDSANAKIRGHFAIVLQCRDHFQVKAVYAKVDDPDSPDHRIEVRYFNVFAREDSDNPESWQIDHKDFDPRRGRASLAGYELLSKLEVEKPVGIARGVALVISGEVEFSGGSNMDDELTVTAIFESAGFCSVRIRG